LVTDNKIEMSHKNNDIIKAMGGHLKCISLEWTGSLKADRHLLVTVAAPTLPHLTRGLT